MSGLQQRVVLPPTRCLLSLPCGSSTVFCLGADSLRKPLMPMAQLRVTWPYRLKRELLWTPRWTSTEAAEAAGVLEGAPCYVQCSVSGQQQCNCYPCSSSSTLFGFVKYVETVALDFAPHSSYPCSSEFSAHQFWMASKWRTRHSARDELAEQSWGLPAAAMGPERSALCCCCFHLRC